MDEIVEQRKRTTEDMNQQELDISQSGSGALIEQPAKKLKTEELAVPNSPARPRSRSPSPKRPQPSSPMPVDAQQQQPLVAPAQQQQPKPSFAETEESQSVSEPTQKPAEQHLLQITPQPSEPKSEEPQSMDVDSELQLVAMVEKSPEPPTNAPSVPSTQPVPTHSEQHRIDNAQSQPTVAAVQPVSIREHATTVESHNAPTPAVSTDVLAASSVNLIGHTEQPSHPISNAQTESNVNDGQRSKALLREQMKWCGSTLKTLKRHGDSGPFSMPVDPIALNIPDYFDKIKKPMDFSTIERKLNDLRYETPEDFIGDVKLVFENCFVYNPPGHLVHEMGRRLEKAFSAQLKRFPTELAINPKPSSASSTGPFSPQSARPHAVGVSEDRRKSGSRKTDDIKWCYQVHRELEKKQYYAFMFPFYQPVDPIALNIPTYFDIIKRPMDLSTMKRKLDNGQYTRAEEYEADFNLMVQNCFTFNRPGDDVYMMGQKAEELFKKKWRSRVTHESVGGSSSSNRPRKSKGPDLHDSEDSSLDDEDESQIRILEMQIAMLQNQILAIKQRKKSKSKRSDKSRSRRTSKTPVVVSDVPQYVAPPPQPKPAPAPPQPKPPKPPKQPRQPAKKKEPVLREISFEEKKELSEEINRLSGEKLARVVQIIHESMPQLSNASGQEEIELDIDSLDLLTLNRLWKSVMGKKRRRPPGTNPTEAADRIATLERELAMMDGRVDKAKKAENMGFDHGTSTEDSDESASDDSESE